MIFLKKTTIILLLIIATVASVTVPSFASVNKVNVYIDGAILVCDTSPREINGIVYVPIRAFCDALGADAVSWSSTTKTAKVNARKIEVSASENNSYIIANGRYLYLAENENIDNRIFVPLSSIAQAFGCEVSMSYTDVFVKDNGTPIKSGDSFYDADEVWWLARIIHAESQGEPLLGKIAVGNVVLNRVNHKDYPNTIYGVIFDKKYGVQFTPAASGTIYNNPGTDSVTAAKICLEGYSVSNRILFFMNPRIATSNWISKNRTFAFSIKNHDFYY